LIKYRLAFSLEGEAVLFSAESGTGQWSRLLANRLPKRVVAGVGSKGSPAPSTTIVRCG
jgi:hypothetical protein